MQSLKENHKLTVSSVMPSSVKNASLLTRACKNSLSMQSLPLTDMKQDLAEERAAISHTESTNKTTPNIRSFFRRRSPR